MNNSTVLTALLTAIVCVTTPVSADSYSGGGGTDTNPYLIAHSTDWQELMGNDTDWDCHFKLIAPLDLGGIALTPVGSATTKFTGVFDGAGNTIYNAVVNLPDGSYVGLFGSTGYPAAIRNVRLENAEVTGRFWVGGLVGGINESTIENAGFSGSVTGVAYIGGLAGLVNGMTGTVSGCYAAGRVTGSRYLGGLVGYTWGATINDCYSQAAVVGVADALGGSHRDIGGLIGRTYETTGYANTVNTCYAAGTMMLVAGTPNAGGLVGLYEGGMFTNCFWDVQVSGQHTSPVGMGKTTSQMKRRDTFTAAGWDFAEVWADGQHQAYPYLRLRPAGDIDGDGLVKLDDLAIMAAQWLSGAPNPADYDGIEWVSINDPGFVGQISKYETTNAQYCQYLNAAQASGAIVISGDYVRGNSGTYAGYDYCNLAGPGWTGNGAMDGGASKIIWNGTAFIVEAGFENHPVTYVSWYGAMAFADFYGWQLPTKDQWQAVADYDGSYVYGCGPTISNGIANYWNSAHPHGTTEVGSYGVYGYGIADMAGNVFEWTSTVLGGTRVICGGTWYNYAGDCTVTGGVGFAPLSLYAGSGFRVCR